MLGELSIIRFVSDVGAKRKLEEEENQSGRHGSKREYL